MRHEVEDALLVGKATWIGGRGTRVREARIVGIIHPAPAVVRPEGVVPVLHDAGVAVTDLGDGSLLFRQDLSTKGDVESIVTGHTALDSRIKCSIGVAKRSRHSGGD